jgi:hypothetical protein
MKTIRSLMTSAALIVAFLALGTPVVRGQAVPLPRFSGTFTLPTQAQWGKMTLPAGEYALHYGALFGGISVVHVAREGKGVPGGFVLPLAPNSASRTKNAILCIRDGNTLIVRALEMPVIGESVTFAMPRGAKVVAHNGKHNGYTQLAEAPRLIERIPVTLSAK